MIERRLRALVRQRAAWDSLALALFTLAMAGALLLLVVSLFWSGWVMAALAIPVGLLVWRLTAQNRFWQVAKLVEERFPEVRGKLVAAIQLAHWAKTGTVPRAGRSGGLSPSFASAPKQGTVPVFAREGYSQEMIGAAVADVERAFQPLPLARMVNRRRAVWAAAALLLMAVCFGALVRSAPARVRVGMSNAFGADAGIAFEVLPGDTAVMPGGSVTLRARVSPAGVFRSVRLVTRSSSDLHRPLSIVALHDDTCRVSLAAGHGFEYRFRVLGQSSDPYRVRVLEPLGLERLAFTLHPPGYSGLPVARTSGTEVTGLKGTVVEVDGEANREMSAGRIVLGPDTVPLRLGTRSESSDDSVMSRASSEFRAEFRIRGDAAGTIELADTEDRVLQPAAEVRVRAIADEPPFVKLFGPGRDVDLPVSMQVLLGINSIDDFGLGDLYLHYAKGGGRSEEGGVKSEEGGGFRTIRLKGLAGRREDTTLYAWDLSEAGFLPGEAMRYFVSVYDNDVVSGPKQSRTETFLVRFPTMTEIYNAAVRQTERTASELGPMQSEQAQLGEELNRLSEELKRSRELSWEERQALEKVLGGQEGLMQQVADLKQEVSDMMRELSQGMTLDQQTMERMGQLQQLLSELLPRELQQSLDELRNKLAEQSPDVKRALEKFELDQEKMKQAIDRALELLKMVMEEQRLEALARKAEELANAQEELTSKLGREPAERSARMEQELKDALDSLQQEMKNLADSLSDREIGDSLAGLADRAEQEKLSELARQLAEQMRQGNPGQAKPGSAKLGQGLRKLSQSLDSLSKRLKKKRSAEVAEELRGAAQDLLMVSDEQEKMEDAAPGIADLSERAPQEMGLHDATRIVAESLASLGSRSMSVEPQLGQELARAMNAMEQAAQAMVENRAGSAQAAMARARSSLNRTVQALLEAMAAAQQGKGMSGGMEALMQQLSQMSCEQMGINAGMSGFPMPIPGGLTPGQAAALGRILGKQRALREQLEQMLQSMGGAQPGLTSSLEGLLDEMKAVERDLAELNVTRELIQRQESILSHLLDAQRSIRQQGFKEERQSEAGREFELRQVPRLPQDRGERNRLLREELLRALKQGYPAEYERMIRNYFQRLLNE